MTILDLFQAYQNGQINKHVYIERMHRLHQSLFDYSQLLKGSEVERIEIDADRVIVTSRRFGMKFICDQQNRRIAPFESLNFGVYEAHETDMVLRLMPASGCFVDIGANVGWYSILVAKAVPGATVYAFEPIPSTYQLLMENILLNGAGEIHPHNFALGAAEDQLDFYFHPENSDSASQVNILGRPDAQKLVVPVHKLDDVASAENLTIDFVKCDVEGAELMVVRGALQTIKRDRPILFLEMLRKWSAKFGYHPNEIIDLLSALGYHCFRLDTDSLRRQLRVDEQTTATNFFFLHADHHADQISQWCV
jgi:FkbM family methyltransferase